MQPLQRLQSLKALSLSPTASRPSPLYLNGQLIGIPDNRANYIDKAYLINDMVYSVINLILDKVRIPEWGVYKVVDEQALKQFSSMMRRKDLYGKDFLKALDLHKKAVEPLKGNSRLHELVKWANESETFNDFFANGCGFKMLTGDKFVSAQLLNEGANRGRPGEFINLPSQEITIKATREWPIKEIGYLMQTFQIPFTKEEVLHEKYWNPGWGTNAVHLYGMSPIKAALMTVARSNSAMRAGAKAFENMGPPGVLFVDDNRWDAEETLPQAEALKEKLYNEHTGTEYTNKIATSGYKVGWTEIGLSPVDLNIIESQKWDLRAICNIFGVPSQLLNDPDNKTYANQKEGEAALTSRCAMPQLVSGRANFNRKLQTDWGYKGENVIIDFDPNVFTELRQSAADVAAWTSQMIAISPNEQRTLMGMDALEGTEFDEPWISTSGRQPFSDYQMNEVENELNGGADPEDDL